MNAFSDANAQRKRENEERTSAATNKRLKKENKRANWGVLQAVI